MAKKYKHGSMDISSQEAGFDGFIKFSKYFCYFVIVLLVFMAIFRT